MNNQQVSIIEQVMIKGDLSVLDPGQRVQYYNAVCDSVGLNPLTKPFDYIVLGGKLVLYANKGAGEQLRQRHGISLKITDKQKIDDVYVVTAEAVGKDGRVDSATGAVSVAGLKGEQLANAFMKTETKAKRRVTLSICGLNMLDETEVENIGEKQNEKKQIANASTTKLSVDTPGALQSGQTGGARPESSNHVIDEPETAADTTNNLSNGDTNPCSAGSTIGSYRIPFGNNKGQTLIEAGYEAVCSTYDWLKGEEEKGKPLKGAGLEFIKQAELCFPHIKN